MPNDKAPEAPRETASVWLQVRVRPTDKARWNAQAAREGMSLSQWIIRTLNYELEARRVDDER